MYPKSGAQCIEKARGVLQKGKLRAERERKARRETGEKRLDVK